MSIAISPANTLVAHATETGLHVTGRNGRKLGSLTTSSPTHAVTWVMSHVTAHHAAGHLWMWDWALNTQVTVRPLDEPVHCVASDYRRVVVGTNTVLKTLDLYSRQFIGDIGCPTPVTAVSLIEDNVAIGHASGQVTLMFYNGSSSVEQVTDTPITGVHWSPDGNKVLVSAADQALVCDRNLRPLVTVRAQRPTVRWTTHQQFYVRTEDRLDRHDLFGRLVWSMPFPGTLFDLSPRGVAATLRDGKVVIRTIKPDRFLAMTDKELVLWLASHSGREAGHAPGMRRQRLDAEREAGRRGLKWWRAQTYGKVHDLHMRLVDTSRVFA